LLVLHLLALLAAEGRKALPPAVIKEHLEQLAKLPKLMETQLPMWVEK